MPQSAPFLELVAVAHKIAHEHSLAPELVCAVIEQESGWNPWALRYEPAFYERYIQPQLARPDGIRAHSAITNDTEARARAFSWGLMQVMGQVAREHGFASASLATLCDPATGIDVGCRILVGRLAAAEGNVAQALQLWNGGADPGYVAAVLGRTPHYAIT